MRRDTTPENGENYGLHFLVLILYAITAIGLLLYATTLNLYGRGAAFGAVHSKHYAHTATRLSLEKNGTKGGRGLKNHNSPFVYPCMRLSQDLDSQN